MIPSSNLGGASRIVSLWRMKKVRIGLFLFSIFRFPSPIAHLRESFSINLLACKNKRYGFFSISLVLFPLIETSWNLPCKQVLRIMKQLRYGKHLSMISFLPIQCMIFSTRFVAQSVEDFHHAILSGKLLYPRKAKRYSFHPYRLMFIFCQRRRHGCRRAFSLPEFVRRIAPPMRIDSHHAIIQRKTKAAGLPPYRLMFIFSQRRRHGCHRAFSLPESVHRIAPPMRTILTSQTYPESCCIHEKQSGTVFTHTA